MRADLVVKFLELLFGLKGERYWGLRSKVIVDVLLVL